MRINKLEKILDYFKKIKIAVIGDIILDNYIIGTVDRISPEAPVSVVSITGERFVLGGAANVVNNLVSLGSKPLCFGIIGEDSNGYKLLNAFREKNIDVTGIFRIEDRPTTIKKRIISGTQQLLRLDLEDNSKIKKEIEDLLLSKIREHLYEIDAFILSDYDKGVLTPRIAKKIIEMAKQTNKIVIVDPKPKNIQNYIGATSITPNRKEARECLGKDKNVDILKVGKELKVNLALENLLLTKSEEGISLFEKDKVKHMPTYAKEVYDVTGAGDTVIAIYTLAGASGVKWDEAAKIANVAASIVVGKIGTSTVTREDILKFYKDN